jgi:transposase
VRSIGMDVHRDFCEIAIAEGGSVRAAGRVASDPEALRLLAQSLVSTDEVAIEATANAVAIARILEPHVRRVVLANPKAVREKSRRAKTDRIDAKVLARLLAVGFLDEVWTPDDKTQTRRRLITRRCALVRARTRAKNQRHAVLARNLLERPPMTDMFGRKGRIWLAEQAERLPLDEQLSVDAGLRQVDFLNGEVDQILGADAITDPDALRLMTLPGVNMVTAIALLAAIGDIKRFPSPGNWSPISVLTREFANRATSPPGTAGSASRARVRSAGCLSKLPGTPLGPRARCTVSMSAWRCAADRRSRRSRPLARWS